MKTYVVADLHGRFDLLTKALELIEKDAGPEGGRFICLGDFVDRGPQSRQVIERLMDGPASNWEWIILQGNHEAMMLECLDVPGILRWWIGNGGGNTLKSYGYEHGDDLLPLKIPEDHLNWLAKLPVTFEDNHRIFVHAGVPYDKNISETKVETLQWMLYHNGESYPDAEQYDDKAHISGKHIVHGHHQSENHPLLLPHRTNLDSWAWHTGRLAIGVFDNTQAQPIKTMEVK